MILNHATAHGMVRGLSRPHGRTVTRAVLMLNGKALPLDPSSFLLAHTLPTVEQVYAPVNGASLPSVVAAFTDVVLYPENLP